MLKSSKGSRVMKNRRSNDFSAPLEQLRQKESELMRTKIEFDRQMKDKQADLEQKERQIATREVSD